MFHPIIIITQKNDNCIKLDVAFDLISVCQAHSAETDAFAQSYVRSTEKGKS